MANLGFLTKTFTATDWGAPNTSGRLYLNSVYYTAGEAEILFSQNIDTSNYIIGVQAYSVGPMVAYNIEVPAWDITNKFVKSIGWGVESSTPSSNSLTFKPFLQLYDGGNPSNKMDYRSGYLRLSIIVQYI